MRRAANFKTCRHTAAVRCGAMLHWPRPRSDIEPPRASSRIEMAAALDAGTLRRVQRSVPAWSRHADGRALEQWRLSRLRAGCCADWLVRRVGQGVVGDRVREAVFFGGWLAFGWGWFDHFLDCNWCDLLGPWCGFHTGSIMYLCWRPRSSRHNFSGVLRGVASAQFVSWVMLAGWERDRGANRRGNGRAASRLDRERRPFRQVYQACAEQVSGPYLGPDLRRAGDPIAGHAAAYLFRGNGSIG